MSIVVYGATGFTGRLVAEALVRDGHDVVAAGRDAERVRAVGDALGVAHRAARVDDPDALARALEGAEVVVSCAGPFSELGEPVLRAALDVGASFADISGEQAYARRIYERYESRARRERRAVAIGIAHSPAAGDWAAALAASALGPGRIDEIAVAYAASRIPLTPGLLASARASLAAPASVWAHDRWEPARPAGDRRLVGFPAPLGVRLAIAAPLAEVITIPRHVDVAAVSTFFEAGVPSPARKLALVLVGAAAPALPVVARSAWSAEASALASARPTEEELARARVAVIAEARRGFDRARVALSGGDPYRLTALIAALCAPALRGREGALAPAEIVVPADALDALRARAGVHIERGS